MKKTVAVNIILCVVIFLPVLAYADTLSTSKTIDITLEVLPKPVFEDRSEIIFVGSNGGSKSEMPSHFSNKAPPSHSENLFSRVITAIKNFFTSK